MEKWFPIQGEHGDTAEFKRIGQLPKRAPGRVPWGIAAEAYKVYARRYGTSQSLERLAERGGFGWSELVALLRDDENFPKIPFVRNADEP